MIKFLLYAATFAAGAVVGGLVVREIAIRKVTGPVESAANALFGDGSYASGEIVTQVNAYLRDN